MDPGDQVCCATCTPTIPVPHTPFTTGMKDLSGEEERLPQHLYASKITTFCQCFILRIDCFLKQSLQKARILPAAHCVPCCVFSLIPLFFPVAYSYSPEIITVPRVCIPFCTLQAITISITSLNFQSNLESVQSRSYYLYF